MNAIAAMCIISGMYYAPEESIAPGDTSVVVIYWDCIECVAPMILDSFRQGRRFIFRSESSIPNPGKGMDVPVAHYYDSGWKVAPWSGVETVRVRSVEKSVQRSRVWYCPTCPR